MYEIIETYVDPIYFRVFKSIKKDESDIYILIHGWQGNEKVMSIFTSSIPEKATVIFPRGLVDLQEDRFGWVDFRESPTTFEDYKLVSKLLIKSLINLFESFNLNERKRKINLIGFSQGAAMSAVLSILYPDFFQRTAILAGFLPSNSPPALEKELSTSSYYIAHGTDDEMVSFQKSIELKEYLERAGAHVQFCKEDIGHKVGRECLKNLKIFFNS